MVTDDGAACVLVGRGARRLAVPPGVDGGGTGVAVCEVLLADNKGKYAGAATVAFRIGPA